MCFYTNCENASIHTIILKNLIVWINMFQNNIDLIIYNIVFFIFNCVSILINTYLYNKKNKEK